MTIDLPRWIAALALAASVLTAASTNVFAVAGGTGPLLGFEAGLAWEGFENLVSRRSDVQNRKDSPRKLRRGGQPTAYPQVVYLNLTGSTFIEAAFGFHSDGSLRIRELVVTFETASTKQVEQLSAAYGPPTDVRQTRTSIIYGWGTLARPDDVMKPLPGRTKALRAEYTIDKQLIIRQSSYAP